MNSLQFEAVARAQHAATNPSLQHISHLGPAQVLAIAQSREAQIHGARMRQSHEQDKDRAMAGLGAWMMKNVHNRHVLTLSSLVGSSLQILFLHFATFYF